MKTFKSMILQDHRPLEDGMDLALVYADANREILLPFINNKKTALKGAREKLTAARKKKPFLVGAIITALSVLLLFVSIGLGIIGIIVGIISAIYMVINNKKDIEKLEKEEHSINAWEPPDNLSHIGKMYYQVDVIPFEDGKLVVDTSGIQQRTKFVYPEIPQAVNRLKEIVESMKQLPGELSILLPPSSSPGLQGEEPLTGIEGDMAHILSLNRQLLDEKIDATAQVPAFSSNSDVVHSLHFLSGYLEAGEPGAVISQPTESVEQSLKGLKAINENAKEIEKLGGENDENIMRNVSDEMDMQINRTKRARDYSLLDVLGKNLDELKSLYDYPLTRFYCPKCHKVPPYIITRELPVPITELDKKPVDQLKDFYKSNEIVHFRKLVDNIRRHLDQARQDGEDLSSEHYQILESKLVSYEEKIRELALEIEGIDTKAEVHSRNAVLKYNTQHNHWKCQLCGKIFTKEEAQWARMLKIKDDLILPVWDKLWLEKHNESMRIIREKESELRKNKELEAKQLRAEANVFTQEYREVRNQLEAANAEYQVARQQFQMMCDFFERRGILSAETVASLRNDIMGNTNADLSTGQIIEVSDQLENQLEQEPETVFLRRGQLHDYTEEIRNTQKYFQPSAWELFMIEDQSPSEEEQQVLQEQQEVENV
jgi:transposase-like protein